MELAQTLLPLVGVVVGGAVATVVAYLQHRWTGKREDLRQAEDARLKWIQAERDVIADLIIALYGYVTSVVNLKYAYGRASEGAKLDIDRVREFQAAGEAFGPALVRARLTVRNPAARPALDDLHAQHVRMSSHLGLAALGEPSAKFAEHFDEFHRVVGEAKVALEEAALTYDGVIQDDDVRPGAVAPKPRPRRSAEQFPTDARQEGVRDP